jgi:hypothetical protein
MYTELRIVALFFQDNIPLRHVTIIKPRFKTNFSSSACSRHDDSTYANIFGGQTSVNMANIWGHVLLDTLLAKAPVGLQSI